MQEQDKPKRKNEEPTRSRWSCLIELGVIVLVVFVVIMIAFVMLGPTIGNIFSNINCLCLPANL